MTLVKLTLKEILEAANTERRLSKEAFDNMDYLAGITHGVAYWALTNRKNNFKTPPTVTPAGTPAGARQVPFEDTDVVSKRMAT